MAAICCQARARAWRAAGCSGTTASDGLGGRQDLGPLGLGQGRVEGLDLGRGRLLPASRSRRAAATAFWAAITPRRGQPLGAVEVLVGVAELAAAGLGQRPPARPRRSRGTAAGPGR